ncbi:MAG: class I SAM-dependent methyltransferase [bacterium]|nr:class I SAM-dependent methyltransferase [bacterium]
MTFFSFKRVAEGYAAHRPFYHPLVIAKIRARLGLEGKLSAALDVGCGTGLSTVALCEIADHVVGTDSSAEMIEVARGAGNAGVVFHCAPAEDLRFPDGSFDVITVGGAINWIDRERFLPEAQRVLGTNGSLVAYDNFIADRMSDVPLYTQWFQEQYLYRYPKPPRDEAPLTTHEAERHGFRLDQEEYSNSLSMSKEQYVEFMLTQSNIISAVDMGSESLSAAREWMNQTLAPVFPEGKAALRFEGYVWYLRAC